MSREEGYKECIGRAVERYAKGHYYRVLVRFPKEWEGELREVSHGEINRYIIGCVGEKIGREYHPKELIKRKK